MFKKRIALLALVAVSVNTAFAAVSPAKTEYDAAKKAAATQYAEDRKLCGEETSSKARMQCLRDAKTEYSAALKAASDNFKQASATPAAPAASATPAAKPVIKAAVPVCAECGKVTAVRQVEQKGEGTPLGMIAGGVAGAVLGHQVGDGRGKKLATIAGAAGGAYAGHKVEEHVRTTHSWLVTVHFEDGSDRDYAFATDPGYVAGDNVKSAGNSIERH